MFPHGVLLLLILRPPPAHLPTPPRTHRHVGLSPLGQPSLRTLLTVIMCPPSHEEGSVVAPRNLVSLCSSARMRWQGNDARYSHSHLHLHHRLRYPLLRDLRLSALEPSTAEFTHSPVASLSLFLFLPPFVPRFQNPTKPIALLSPSSSSVLPSLTWFWPLKQPSSSPLLPRHRHTAECPCVCCTPLPTLTLLFPDEAANPHCTRTHTHIHSWSHFTVTCGSPQLSPSSVHKDTRDARHLE